MALHIHRKSLSTSFSFLNQKSFNWQQYCHEGWGKRFPVEVTAMENNNMHWFFLHFTFQPSAKQQAQNHHFFFGFSTPQSIFVTLLQTD